VTLRRLRTARACSRAARLGCAVGGGDRRIAKVARTAPGSARDLRCDAGPVVAPPGLPSLPGKERNPKALAQATEPRTRKRGPFEGLAHTCPPAEPLSRAARQACRSGSAHSQGFHRRRVSSPCATWVVLSGRPGPLRDLFPGRALGFCLSSQRRRPCMTCARASRGCLFPRIPRTVSGHAVLSDWGSGHTQSSGIGPVISMDAGARGGHWMRLSGA